MKTIEAKVKIKIQEAIESVFTDDDFLNEFLQNTDNMYFSDNYSERMADAAVSVLFSMADLWAYLREQGELK